MAAQFLEIFGARVYVFEDVRRTRTAEDNHMNNLVSQIKRKKASKFNTLLWHHRVSGLPAWR